MKYCKYCGCPQTDDAEFCTECGKRIGTARAASSPASRISAGTVKAFCKKYRYVLVACVAVLAVLVGVTGLNNLGKCSYVNCKQKAVRGYHYCDEHKCNISSCDKSKSGFYSNKYCYSHYLLYEFESDYAATVYSSQLKISGISLTNNGSYTVVTGKITNNSSTTVEYVKIKGSFVNSSGKVLDTDWTYAVGSEGLEPGESCSWRMSVDKDYSIKECTVTILDFDY